MCPAAVVHCAAYTDVDGAECNWSTAEAVNASGAGHVALAAAQVGARIVHVSTDYVFDGSKREPWVESDPVAPLGVYGDTKLAGEQLVAAANPAHAIVRTAWLFGAGGRNFVDTMLALGAQRDEVSVVTDQVGCPTWTGHLAGALVELAERPGETGDPARRRQRPVLVERVRAGDLRARRDRLPRAAGDERAVRAPGAAPRLQRPGQRAPRPGSCCPPWQRGLAEYLATRVADLVKLLVCGGAGFIGSAFVRVRLRDHGDEVVVLDKLTYAGRRENLAGLDIEFVHAGIEDADAVAAAMDRRRRGRQLRRRDPRRPLDRRARRVRHDARRRHLGAARGRRGAPACATCRSPPTRSTARSRRARSPRARRCAPSSPYSATKAGADLLVASYFHTYDLPTVICRGSNNYGPRQYPEKLIPLMILNALHGDPLPVYGDGMQVRNWLYVDDFARGIGHVLAHGAPGEAYNVGGPDECPNLEVVRRIIELTGADEALLTYVKDRPGHDRRYSLGSEKVRALGWEAQVRFAEGLDETVAWYQANREWWEPIRSGDYRAYYARQYGSSIKD